MNLIGEIEDLVHRTLFRGRDARMEPPISKRRKTTYDWNPSNANNVFASSQNINPFSVPGKPTRHQDLKIWQDAMSPLRPCVTYDPNSHRAVKGPSEADALLDRISSWVDTRYSVKKVLERGGAAGDHFLPPGANRRFLELHRDMDEECGPGALQHSWGAIETSEEVLLYGPYYPDYGSREHSEDFVVGQTEELLVASSAGGGCSVYIFTQNSPCLDRDTQPCMLHLVEKALEWHARYGARTHVGYARCWGFNGNKETLFRDVDGVQLELAASSPDRQSYLEAARKLNVSPLAEDLLSAVRRLLLGAGAEHLEFPLKRGTPEQNWKGSFEGVNAVSERESQIEGGGALAQETDAMMEAAGALVSGGEPRSLQGHLGRGRTFAREYAFGAGTCEAGRAEARLGFERRWKDMVEGRYAKVIRNRLTKDFNRRVTCMFSEEVARFDKDYIQIGRIRFSEECAPSPEESLL